MFLAAGVQLVEAGGKGVFAVEGNGLQLAVEKVHQFESRFQSMSVLVLDKSSGKRFVFAKGAPEKLHALSLRKFEGFADLVKQLSLEGLRSIAVAVR